LGAGCQEFESPYPDHIKNPRIERYGDFFCLRKSRWLQVIVQLVDNELSGHGHRDELTKLLLVDMKTVVDGSGKQLSDLADLFTKQVAAESEKSKDHYETSRSRCIRFTSEIW
jgi:hypothetical protein